MDIDFNTRKWPGISVSQDNHSVVLKNESSVQKKILIYKKINFIRKSCLRFSLDASTNDKNNCILYNNTIVPLACEVRKHLCFFESIRIELLINPYSEIKISSFNVEVKKNLREVEMNFRETMLVKPDASEMIDGLTCLSIFNIRVDGFEYRYVGKPHEEFNIISGNYSSLKSTIFKHNFQSVIFCDIDSHVENIIDSLLLFQEKAVYFYIRKDFLGKFINSKDYLVYINAEYLSNKHYTKKIFQRFAKDLNIRWVFESKQTQTEIEEHFGCKFEGLKYIVDQDGWGSILEHKSGFCYPESSVLKETEKGEKLLSIFVPSYNMESYLTRCLNSMLCSKYRDYLDILVVNDGSQDRTLEIAKQFAKKFPNIIRVIDQKNLGHGGAINSGLTNSVGKYFKNLDGDDWVSPQQLNLFMEYLDNSSTDLVLNEVNMNFANNSFSDPSIYYKNLKPNKVYKFGEIDFRHYFPFFACSTYKKHIKDSIKPLPEKMAYVDMPYNTYAYGATKSVSYSNTHLYNYQQQRPGQDTSLPVRINRYKEREHTAFLMIDIIKSDEYDSKLRKFIINNLIFEMLQDNLRIMLLSNDISKAIGVIRAIHNKNKFSEYNKSNNEIYWEILKQEYWMKFSLIPSFYIKMFLMLTLKSISYASRIAFRPLISTLRYNGIFVFDKIIRKIATLLRYALLIIQYPRSAIKKLIVIIRRWVSILNTKKLIFFHQNTSSIYTDRAKEIFTEIYDSDLWTNGSGPGSHPNATVDYRKLLQKFFDDPQISSYVDLGCGDWQIMSLIDIPDNKTYFGYDIVESVIKTNKEKYAKHNIKFYVSSAINKIKSADLLIIKDVMIHWSNSQISECIKNIFPRFKYVLITNDYIDDSSSINLDIEVGDFKCVDITLEPFCLKNTELVLEYEAHGKVKRVYLYTNQDLKK